MIRPIAAAAGVLAITSLVILLTGDHPVSVFGVLLSSAFGSWENLSYTLFYATPVLLAGVGVRVALESGLVNIGAEGQLYVGALSAVAWAIAARGLPGWVSVAGGLFFSVLGGALWGALAGYLRAYRHTHEVISTILLNFVGIAVVNWAVLNPFKNPEVQYPETLWLQESARIPRLWHQATPGLLLAAAVAVFLLWAVKKTWWGFRLRAAGANPIGAETAGIRVARVKVAAMALSGGVAGLIGFHEIYCNSYRLIDGFSPGYGFTGLSLALLARNSLPRMLGFALLFGALQKGALDLDIETDKITRELATVIQALILIAIATTVSFKERRRQKRKTA